MGVKKLVVDFEVCRKCKDCVIKCSFPFHPVNDGSLTLREIIAWQVVCRRCNQPGCVPSCPTEALKKREDGLIERSNTLCISCKSCTIGCPFGTIFPELVPYLTTGCDYCQNRLAEDEKPLCVQSCPPGAIEYREVTEKEETTTVSPDTIAGIATSWQKIVEEKKK